MQKIFSALEKSYPGGNPPFQFMAHFSVFTGSKAKPYGDTQVSIFITRMLIWLGETTQQVPHYEKKKDTDNIHFRV